MSTQQSPYEQEKISVKRAADSVTQKIFRSKKANRATLLESIKLESF